MRRIYLDYNASTPVDPRVAEAMRAATEDGYGNPSSLHWAGAPAKEIVEKSRQQVAALLGCAPEGIVFTSGGSEANNLAEGDVFRAARSSRAHHHHAGRASIDSFALRVSGTARRSRHVPAGGRHRARRPGRPAPRDRARHDSRQRDAHANNEVGTIQPIEACARVAREHGIPFHTDAAQLSVGKIPTCVDELGVDLLSIAGHKLYAPKGVGALYVRTGTKLEPLIHGAGHEGGRRAGTESAMLAAGLGAACVLAGDLTPMEGVRELRERFWTLLRALLGERVVLNGHPDRRLPNTLNVSFVGRIGADILAAMEGVAASTGSACHTGRIELSPVLPQCVWHPKWGWEPCGSV